MKTSILVMLLSVVFGPALHADVVVWAGKGKLATASGGGSAKLPAEVTLVVDPASGEASLLVATVFEEKVVRIRTSSRYKIGEVAKGKATKQTKLSSFSSWEDDFTSSAVFRHVFAYFEGKKKVPLTIRDEGEPVSLPPIVKGSFETARPTQLETITLNVKYSEVTTRELNGANATLTSAVQTIFDQYLEDGYQPENVAD